MIWGISNGMEKRIMMRPHY